ncbi:MAG: polysaccharide biosynthesis/export family protein [Flavisolibacter sp.]
MRTITFFKLSFILSVFSLLESCAVPQKTLYLENATNSKIDVTPYNYEAAIQKNDVLGISVSSINPQASMIFNTAALVGSTSSGNGAGEGNSAASSGYLVNADGYIQFPVLGSIKAEGLTNRQLQDELSKRMLDKKLLIDPIVTVRQLNYHVTVLGEVTKPTVINVPNEKINIMEAIGLAGDLTSFGRKDNVLLIREENGQKIIQRLDLSSPSILTSPYYYLRSNDIVYAEPNKLKLKTANNGRSLFPYILSAISVTALVITRFVK